MATVSCPWSGTLLFTLLAERLGQPVGREPSRLGAWRALERAVRLASLQNFQVVLTIDDCDDQVDATTRRDLDSLAHLGFDQDAGLTIIQVERTDGEPAGRGRRRVAAVRQSRCRSLVLRQSVSRDEARAGGKFGTDLHAAGDHAPSRFIAGTSARTGTAGGALSADRGGRGLEVISPDLVDAVAGERMPATLAAGRELQG